MANFDFGAQRRSEYLIRHFNESKADFELICEKIQSEMENIENLDKQIVDGLCKLKEYIDESIKNPEGILATNLRKHDIDQADLTKKQGENEEALKAVSIKLLAIMDRSGFKPLNNESAKKLLIEKMVEKIQPDKFITKYTSYVSSKCLRSLYNIDEKLKVLDRQAGTDMTKRQRGVIALIKSRIRFKEWCSHFSEKVCPEYISKLEEITEVIDKTNSELEELSKTQKMSNWLKENHLGIIGKTVGFFGF